MITVSVKATDVSR